MDSPEMTRIPADAMVGELRRLRFAVWALTAAFVLMGAALGAVLVGIRAEEANQTAVWEALAVSTISDTDWIRRPSRPRRRPDSALRALEQAETPRERFRRLGPAALVLLDRGEVERARAHAEELAELAPYYVDDGSYAGAVGDMHVVLGRLAVRDGDLEAGTEHLRLFGEVEATPVRRSFGPDMSLARDLLHAGEIDAVVRFFEVCRAFWDMEDGRLDEWTRIARAGGVPDFGRSLRR